MDRTALVHELEKIVGKGGVLVTPADLAVYSYDASIDRHMPDVVVLPTSTEQVAAVVRLAAEAGVPVVARGAGTGLSGGSVPALGGIVLTTARMRRILEVNAEDRYAVVEPGVINLDLTAAVAPHGLYYAPDPASQTVSTLGGNVAENAGGPHCLLYGVTTNHILGLEVVMADGQVVQFGGTAPDQPGYDLRGVLIGSEGTLGIITKITVRLMPKPEAARTLLAIFDHLDDAAQTVSDMISQGIIPAALEMMDATVMKAVEAAYHAGYPPDAEAVLLIEVDGLPDGLDEMAAACADLCRQHQAREVRLARTEEERVILWKGRKGALGALGRLAPSYIIQDAVVPRSKLPEILRFLTDVSKKYGLGIANNFHAGDGNLHPNFLIDPRQPGVLDKARAASEEVVRLCVALGGTITGEHGVGIEKQDFMPYMFSEDDLAQMRKLRAVFDPQGIMNPGKIFPGAKRERREESAKDAKGEKGVMMLGIASVASIPLTV